MSTTTHDLPPDAAQTLREFYQWFENTLPQIDVQRASNEAMAEMLTLYFTEIAPRTPVYTQRAVYEMI